MARFSTPAFERQLIQALAALDDTIDVQLQGYSLAENIGIADPPDVEIAERTTLGFSLPKSDSVEISAAELVSLTREVTSKDTTFDGLLYCSTARAVVRIEASDERSYFLADRYRENDAILARLELPSLGDDSSVGIVTKSLHFSMSIVQKEFFWDKHVPPVSAGDLFIEIIHNGKLDRNDALEVVYAYLFEVSSSLRLQFELRPRPTDDGEVPDDDELDELERGLGRLRPLILGPGLGTLHREFHRGTIATEPETAVLAYVKCLEHVSATVVREKQYDDLLRRLMNPVALNPTAAYMDGLMELCEENRIYIKDFEALRLTVEKCCDCDEFLELLPQSLRARLPSSIKKPADRRQVLVEFAATLSATRNEHAHSKANYDRTGKECPAEHLRDLAECARVAAVQCIRWYSAQNPDLRRG